MDVDRFAAELPGLFDDFPRSATPRGLRFGDVIDGIPNLATENVLALLNLAASLLGPGESYVEVGSYYGASLIGAMRGNTGDFVAVDRFSFDVPEVRGRPLPRANRAGLEESLARFDADSATILEGDAFELVEGGALGDRRVGVYYWDGPHDYDGQLRGMRAVEPWLADGAVIVVDDYDWGAVARATHDYVAADPQNELLVEIGGEAAEQVWWWDGIAVVARRG
ncbi:MAG: class I SAM-dependent methyltransferase [Verrucomicrobiota bacterium]